MSPGTNLLITGASGVGKSTLCERAGRQLDPALTRGFYSRSIWSRPPTPYARGV